MGRANGGVEAPTQHQAAKLGAEDPDVCEIRLAPRNTRTVTRTKRGSERGSDGDSDGSDDLEGI